MITRSTAHAVSPYKGSLALFLLFFFFVALASAQQVPQGAMGTVNRSGIDPGAMMQRRGDETILQVSVYDESGNNRLDRQSVVKITHEGDHSVNWFATDETSQASLGLPYGKYQLEASAVGYLPEQKEVQLASLGSVVVQFNLHRDPTAAKLEIAEASMPPKARKQAKHAVSSLRSGNLKDAKKKLDVAYQLAPSNPDLNFLLGYMYYQQRNLGQAQNYLEIASNLSSRHLQALTLLGRVQLMEQDYPAAATTLEKAVAADPDYWFAHNLLADAYLKEKKFEESRQEAELAISQGKMRANPANLALGQALVSLGKRDEGIAVLKAFVQDSPKNPAVPQIRDLIATLDGHPNDSLVKYDTEGAPKSTTAALTTVDPLLASPEIPVTIKAWQPPGIDEVKPPVAPGATCPYETVLAQSGQRMKDLVDDVAKIGAIEHLLHEQVDDMGNAVTRETRDYNYVISIAENQPGFLAVDEYRSDHLSRSDYPDQIYSGGFSALALIFHPVLRGNFDMTCEGLGNWRGQAAWMVHFRQRDDRPARIHDYKVNGNVYPLRLKGRAWITADKFEIVRIESELISPIPEIRLRSEQLMVDYGPVQFPKHNLELWLPKSGEIYIDFQKHVYFRRHTYDHYMLFSVDAVEKRNEPKPPAEPVKNPLPN